MKVVEHLANATRPLVSVEIIPPRRGGDVQRIYEAVSSILPFDPPFIDIVTRKAPGTFGLCAAIKHRFNVDPVPHVLANGFTREETEDALIELHYLGIENVLVIRGDGAPREAGEGRSTNESGLDLVRQVADMNRGVYLEQLVEATPSDFCIGVAAYPEKHVEAPNLEWDISVLLDKQKAGAHYAVTQIFYDNEVYLRFLKASRDRGVTIPIVPGLKILTRQQQVGLVPKHFGASIPERLVGEMLETDSPERATEVGVRWALEQTRELLDRGVPSVHFYVMQNTRPFVTMMELLHRSD